MKKLLLKLAERPKGLCLVVLFHCMLFQPTMSSARQVNSVPTDIFLSRSEVAENLPMNAFVGEFSAKDEDEFDFHLFSLVEGEGSEDNDKFVIIVEQVGRPDAKLRTAAPFNFEEQNTYSVRVKADDQRGGVFERAFTINLIDLEEAPSDIVLSTYSVEETRLPGELVGDISVIDEDASNTDHTLSLTETNDYQDNSDFQIVDNQLLTNRVLDFETKSEYKIKIRAFDPIMGFSFSKAIIIKVTDLENDNVPPFDLGLASTTIGENNTFAEIVGRIHFSDPDVGDVHEISLVVGLGSEDNVSFKIIEEDLTAAEIFDYESKNEYQIRIRVKDSDGAVYEEAFIIEILNEVEGLDILSVSPSDESENVPLDAELIIQFDGSVFPGENTLEIRDFNNASLVAQIGFDDNPNLLIINDKALIIDLSELPAGILSHNTWYAVILYSNIVRDFEGNPFESGPLFINFQYWNFRTEPLKKEPVNTKGSTDFVNISNKFSDRDVFEKGNFVYRNAEENSEFKIHSFSGKLIKTLIWDKETPLDMRLLPEGIFVVSNGVVRYKILKK